MPLTNATINIRNLRLRTFIGFNPDEKVKKQDIVVNIEIDYSINQAVLEDKIGNVLDYKKITKQVIDHVERGHFLLLEKLVADVLTICSEQPSVNNARVTIDKPHALRFADSVSLTLDYSRDKTNTCNLWRKPHEYKPDLHCQNCSVESSGN